MKNDTTTGHILALITIFLWAETFISTKILLVDFTPLEILFFRFLLGLFALIIASPKRLKAKNKSEQIAFVGAGITGVCLYYLFENIALTYTMASNVGIIIAAAPFATAFLSHIFLKSELSTSFFIGFVVAMIGVFLINFNGMELNLNPLGDFLALLAAFTWAIYSLFVKKIATFGYSTLQSTKKIFIYGIIFLILTTPFFDFSLSSIKLMNIKYLLNFAFLGFGASALCFVTWNYAIKILGPVKTNVYIYLSPVITVITSALILNEKITLLAIIGTIFILSGLIISETKINFKKKAWLWRCVIHYNSLA